MSIESVMPSNHLIFYRHLLLPPSIFPSIRVFSNEPALCIRWPKYWSFSFSISPSNEYSGLISFRMDWLDIVLYKSKSETMKTCQNFTCSSITSDTYLLNQVTIFDNLKTIFSIFCAIHNNYRYTHFCFQIGGLNICQSPSPGWDPLSWPGRFFFHLD